MSLAVGFALVESGLRLVWRPWSLRSHRLPQASDEYGWAPRPGITGVAATPEYEPFATDSAPGLRGPAVFGTGRRARWPGGGEPFCCYADQHPTPAGNRAVAGLLHAGLAQLLPPR